MATTEQAKLVVEFLTKGDKDVIAAFRALARARAAEAKLTTTQIKANAALSKSTGQSIATTKKGARGYNDMAAAQAIAAKRTKMMGYQAQNASYQLTDLVVQIQGGVHPLRAFSQQIGQLLGSFGPVGAAMGLVGSLGAGLALAFIMTRDAAKSVTDELEDTTAALDAVSESASRLIDGGGAAAQTLYDIRKAASDRELRQFSEALAATADRGALSVMADSAKSAASSLYDLAGVTPVIRQMLFVGEELGGVFSRAADSIMYFANESEDQAKALAKTFDIPESVAANLNNILSSAGSDASLEGLRTARDAIGELIAALPSGTVSKPLTDLFANVSSEVYAFEEAMRVATARAQEMVSPTSAMDKNIQFLSTSLKLGRIELELYLAAMKSLHSGITLDELPEQKASGGGNADQQEKQLARLAERYRATNDPMHAFQVKLKEIASVAHLLSEELQQTASLDAFQTYIKATTVGLTESEQAIINNTTAHREYVLSLRESAAAIELQLDPTMQYEAELDRLLELLNYGGLSWEAYAQKVDEAEKAVSAATGKNSFAVQMFSSMDSAMKSFITGVASGTADIKNAVKSMATAIIADLLRIAAYKTIMSMFGGGSNMGAAFGEATGATAWGSAKGNVVQNGSYKAFAKGGIVTSPTAFPMNTGVGLMAEVGPEAIVPLTRDNSGNMGVRSSPVNVVVNNNAQGVDVQATSDGAGGLSIDVIKQVVASEISAGGSAISAAIESSYSLGRGAGAY